MRLNVMGIGCVALALGAAGVQGQSACEDWDRRGDRAGACEVRESTIGAVSRIEVDGGMNGGITVRGWDQDEILVEAQVFARARDERRAEEIMSDVEVRIDDGRISATGPRFERRENWGVTFRVYVPFETDLDLEAQNGGIKIEDVTGRIRFETMNGGVSLVAVEGDVSGRTTNGGVSVALLGSSFRGEGLDVVTTNGGVTLTIPEGYDAELETGTVNGGMDFDFPVTVRGRINKSLVTTLGEGGAPIRVRTTNGGVKVRRGSAAIR